MEHWFPIAPELKDWKRSAWSQNGNTPPELSKGKAELDEGPRACCI
jgi:hypothetical protein